MAEPSSAEVGFTLIELLVALVLLSLLAGLISGGLDMARLVTVRAKANVTESGSVAAGHLVLRERLEVLYPQTLRDSVEPYAEFSGDATGFAALAPPAPASAPDMLQYLRLRLTSDGRLAMFTAPGLSTRIDPRQPTLRGWTRTDIVNNVAGIDIAYFGSAPPDNRPRWRNRWSQQPALPRLIRIQLRFPAGDRRIWPDLVIRPTASTGSGCVLDGSTGRCAG
jgi:general secretion pathway protein J